MVPARVGNVIATLFASPPATAVPITVRAAAGPAVQRVAGWRPWAVAGVTPTAQLLATAVWTKPALVPNKPVRPTVLWNQGIL